MCNKYVFWIKQYPSNAGCFLQGYSTGLKISKIKAAKLTNNLRVRIKICNSEYHMIYIHEETHNAFLYLQRNTYLKVIATPI